MPAEEHEPSGWQDIVNLTANTVLKQLSGDLQTSVVVFGTYTAAAIILFIVATMSGTLGQHRITS